MSTTIDQSFVRQYEREVHEAYQRKGSKLLMMVRRKPNVVGSSTTFQKMGKGVATTKSRHGLVVPMNVDHTPVTCTLSDFYGPEYIDKLDELKVNHDERRVAVNAGAYALGRKSDNQIMTAADGTTNTNSSGATLTRAACLAAMGALGDRDVFEEGRMYAIVPWTEWTELLTVTEFASSDYAGDNFPYLAGTEARRWLGSAWMPHSGLEDVVSGSTRKSFWFHEDAIGYGFGAQVTSDISWVAERVAFLANNWMSGGAVLIDAAGVQEIQTT